MPSRIAMEIAGQLEGWLLNNKRPVPYMVYDIIQFATLIDSGVTPLVEAANDMYIASLDWSGDAGPRDEYQILKGWAIPVDKEEG